MSLLKNGVLGKFRIEPAENVTLKELRSISQKARASSFRETGLLVSHEIQLIEPIAAASKYRFAAQMQSRNPAHKFHHTNVSRTPSRLCGGR
jgi:hypothetical protein